MTALAPSVLSPSAPILPARDSLHAADYLGALRSSRHLAPNSSSGFCILPSTPAEWAKAVADVKREYLNRRYRPCATRCADILGNVRETDSVEPVHLIYLNFYAATASEMQAKGMNFTSTTRVALLEQARRHYQRASALITAANAAAHLELPGSGRTSPVSSVAASPRVSEPWTPLRRQASLSSSISSFGDVASRSSRPRQPHPKRVTFFEDASDEEDAGTRKGEREGKSAGANDYNNNNDDDYGCRSGPTSLPGRPDSPTLAPAFSPTPPALLRPTQTLHRRPLSTASIASATSIISTPATLHSFYSEDDDGHYDGHEAAAPRRPTSRASHRSSQLLASLQGQVARHLAFVESEIAAAQRPDAAARAAAKRGLLSEEWSAVDLQARIERLRAQGWQRRRFDPSRYEELCEGAMADMME